MRWSERETVTFVKLYLSHQCLWNNQGQSYRNKALRKQASSEIIANFKNATGIRLTEPEVRIKIKNLRSTYCQELLKIKTRSDSSARYVPTIKWFSMWHKCFKHLYRNSDDGLQEDEETEGFGDFEEEKVWLSESEDTKVNSSFVNEDNYVLILKSEPEDNGNSNTNDRIHKRSKRKKMEHRLGIDNLYSTSQSSSNNKVRTEDEFDIYGKYIATQLRQMDLQKALRIKLQIHNLVNEARVSELND